MKQTKSYINIYKPFLFLNPPVSLSFYKFSFINVLDNICSSPSNLQITLQVKRKIQRNTLLSYYY